MALRAHLRRHFGLAVHRLRFVPAGHGADAFVVEAATGGRYFLELPPPHALEWSEPTHLDYYFPLSRALAARGYPARVVAPRPSRAGP